MEYYPIALRLKDQPIVVVGGGKVAERKILTLLGLGAKILVVSPCLTSRLERLAASGRLIWRKARAKKSDLLRTQIVIAATNDSHANKDVSLWARKNKIWVNVVDNPRLSNFISPAVLRRQKAIVTVYTDGKDPVLSRDLKNFLKRNWNEFLSYRKRLQNRAS